MVLFVHSGMLFGYPLKCQRCKRAYAMRLDLAAGEALQQEP